MISGIVRETVTGIHGTAEAKNLKNAQSENRRKSALLLSDSSSFETLRTATHQTGDRSMHHGCTSVHLEGQNPMKIPAALAQAMVVPQIGLCLLTGALLTGAGCVSQQTYDKTRTEADELTRALNVARGEITELDQRIAAMQATNRQEDAVTTELRAAIQHEQDALPGLRQRAHDKLGALQTQVAQLVNQSRLLGREIADAKQEGASLKALVAQHKQEMEESRLSPMLIESAQSTPTTVQSTPTPVVPSVTPMNPVTTPQQTAQATPAPPTKPIATTRTAKGEPGQADDSWTGMIMNWVSSLWGWIFQ